MHTYAIAKPAMLAGLIGAAMIVGLKAEEPAQLNELIISAPAAQLQTESLNKDELEKPGIVNAAESAALLPGVGTVRRGANAAEPVLRGLGWERVATQAGGHPLYGACPSRMDPPATYVAPGSLQGLRVVKAVPSVTLGPAATGGRLMLETDYDRGAGATPGFNGSADATWEEGRDGFRAGAATEGGTRDVDLKATAHAANLGNYTSGGGVEVPANLEERGAALSLGWRPTDDSRVFGHGQFKDEQDVDYPALPMDVEESQSSLLTLGWRSEAAGGLFERLEAHAGWSYVDHLMNNERKSNRTQQQAETPSEALTLSGKLDADWRASPDHLLTLGIDAEHLERDATRTRTMTATGMTFRDPIWPDIERDVFGAFTELGWTASKQLSLRVGGRADFASSTAGSADQMITLAPGNSATVAQRYVDLNGPGAAEVEREETLFSGNALAEWQANEEWSLFAGAGRAERYPAATELYYAFAPAPGGYLVGNPGLDTEKKWEVTTGLRRQNERVELELSVFAALVQDFIAQTRVAQTDVNGDGTVDKVSGFRNVDAELYGGEAAAMITLSKTWSMPLSIAYVRGQNTTDDRDLPEIPPLTGRAALRGATGASKATWAELGLRWAARQDCVDETFPEDETPSFTVFHLRGGYEVCRGFRLEAGVENLFDEDYNEHLTREAVLASDDLAAGDEIPAPGRSFYVKAVSTF